MAQQSVSFPFKSSSATALHASALGAQLRPGDCVLLEGAVGAGKTHFARHLIQSVLIEPEDVPSPTFTLVQIYETRHGPVWHADLYRLSSTYEIEELGLTEAFETAICLVEWPDRLGDLAPDEALSLRFSSGANENSRELRATWSDPRWPDRLSAWRPQ
ncbi:MAG: tRNA (adenosine(37)-N6)-threonylcarbamoyltransferase complex ATPase subunit type 1 TsaE [Pseudomonadota bacterium]